MPERQCAITECPCYQLWRIEITELERQTAHLSNMELHQMAVETWRPEP